MRNLKRALSLALTSAMLLGMMVVGTSAASFKDVDSKDNVEAIEVLKMVGAMKGDDKGNFNPDQVVTRNEMAAVVSKMLGFEEGVKGASMPFVDFNYANNWAKPFVAAIYAKGITAGTGATTFGGADQLTVAQCAMWMLKALGYFQHSGDIAENTTWDLAVATQADEIGLLEGINAGLNEAMTRNQVAQLVLNALKANVVEFTGRLGTEITTSDGTKIMVGYESKYDAKDDVADWNTIKNDDFMQLGEKLYKGDLKMAKEEKSGDAMVAIRDDFGRPAVKWTMKGVDDPIYGVETADKIYTKNMTHEDLYKDLGLKDDSVVNATVDGGDTRSTTINKKGTDGAKNLAVVNGQMVEAFKDGKNVDLVIINTYIGEVTKVQRAKDDTKRYIEITPKTNAEVKAVEVPTLADKGKFETEDFADEDIVLFTVKGDKVDTVKLAEKQTGKVTKVVEDGADSVYYIDGKAFELAYGVVDADKLETSAKVSFYTHGDYIIYVDEATEVTKVEDLALVIAAENGDALNTARAALRLADGKEVKVDVKNGDKGADKNTVEGFEKKIVKVAVKDGVYTLTTVETVKQLAVQADFVYTNKVPTVTGFGNVDNNTVFVMVKDDKAQVITGYKNVPNFEDNATTDPEKESTTAIAAYASDAGKALDLVFVIDYKSSVDAADKAIFVAKTDGKTYTEVNADDETVTYYKGQVVVDGKVETMKLAAEYNTYDMFTTIEIDENGVAKLSGTPDQDFKGQVAYVKYADGVLALGASAESNTKYAPAEGIIVYVIDADGAITIGSLKSVKANDYYTARNYVLDKDNKQVTMLVLVEE